MVESLQYVKKSESMCSFKKRKKKKKKASEKHLACAKSRHKGCKAKNESHQLRKEFDVVYFSDSCALYAFTPP